MAKTNDDNGRVITFQASAGEAIDVSASNFAPTAEKYASGFAVYVGTGGDVKLKLIDDSGFVTLKNVPDGSFLPVKAQAISSDSTASDLIVVI